MTELQSELTEFQRQLRNIGLEQSNNTYADRRTRFLRWLVGDCILPACVI